MLVGYSCQRHMDILLSMHRLHAVESPYSVRFAALPKKLVWSEASRIWCVSLGRDHRPVKPRRFQGNIGGGPEISLSRKLLSCRGKSMCCRACSKKLQYDRVQGAECRPRMNGRHIPCHCRLYTRLDYPFDQVCCVTPVLNARSSIPLSRR